MLDVRQNLKQPLLSHMSTFFITCVNHNMPSTDFNREAATLQPPAGSNKMSVIQFFPEFLPGADTRLLLLKKKCTAIVYTLTVYKYLI